MDFKTTNGAVHFLKTRRQKTPQTPSKRAQCAEKTPRGLASEVMGGRSARVLLAILAGEVQKCSQLPKAFAWEAAVHGQHEFPIPCSASLQRSFHVSAPIKAMLEAMALPLFLQMYNLPPLPSVPALFVLINQCSLCTACR